MRDQIPSDLNLSGIKSLNEAASSHWANYSLVELSSRLDSYKEGVCFKGGQLRLTLKQIKLLFFFARLYTGGLKIAVERNHKRFKNVKLSIEKLLTSGSSLDIRQKYKKRKVLLDELHLAIILDRETRETTKINYCVMVEMIASKWTSKMVLKLNSVSKAKKSDIGLIDA